MRKSKQSIIKSSKTISFKTLALSSRNVGKLEFLKSEGDLPEKDWLEKATAIKRFVYSPLSSKFKKQMGVAKDQYNFCKDQTNVINNNRKNDVKTKDGEIIENVRHNYIADEYKDLINNIFTYGLKVVINRYLKEKDSDVFENRFFKINSL